MAFTSITQSLKSADKFPSIKRLIVETKTLLMAASYILASAEPYINMQDSILILLGRLPSELLTSLWIEKCPGFDQMVAIHFNIQEVDLFDKLMLLSSELGLYSCPDYFHTGTASDSEPILEGEKVRLETYLPAKLAIIDTPINTPHLFLMDKNIVQKYFQGDFIHGTHVAGIAIQTTPKIKLLSFPAIGIIVPIHAADVTHDADIEIFYGVLGNIMCMLCHHYKPNPTRTQEYTNN